MSEWNRDLLSPEPPTFSIARMLEGAGGRDAPLGDTGITACDVLCALAAEIDDRQRRARIHAATLRGRRLRHSRGDCERTFAPKPPKQHTPAELEAMRERRRKQNRDYYWRNRDARIAKVQAYKAKLQAECSAPGGKPLSED